MSGLPFSLQQYRKLLNSLQDGVLILDSSGVVRKINSSAAWLLGVEPGAILGQMLPHDPGVLDEAGRPLHPNEWPAAVTLLTSQPSEARLGISQQDGTIVWLQIRSAPLLSEAGTLEAVVVSVSDITNLKHKEAELKSSFMHDPLTGLPNRAWFFDSLAEVLSSESGTARHAVLLVNLDGFKRVNQLFGHSQGDELLKSVAARLQDCVQADDVVARLGSDEFALILRNACGARQAAGIAREILNSLATPFLIGRADSRVEITASIGIAVAPAGTVQVEGTMRQADIALRRAKHLGHSHFVVYDARLGQRIRRMEELEVRLREGIVAQELSVHYQPIINLADNRVSGAEALLRWNHPEIGKVLPSDFIPLAESTGTIHPLGEWVLDETISQLASWLLQDPGLLLAINLSPRQLESSHFLDRFLHVLDRHGVPARNVMLELTETYLMQEVKRIGGDLRRFSNLGVSIAIDDFGTGYSSLEYLQHLPVSHLKIDQSFVRRCERDSRSLALIEAMLRIGSALSLTVIAEGVETATQLKLLRQAGCSLAQGHLFSPAVPAAEFSALIGRPLVPQHLPPG